MNVLLVSPDPASRDLMRLVVRSIERAARSPLEFLDAPNGSEGVRLALRHRPDAIVADEIASGEGAFSMARTLRGELEPYEGVIAILLERKHDEWLARWSGADAWFVKPVDPFELADRLLELVRHRSELRGEGAGEPRGEERREGSRDGLRDGLRDGRIEKETV